MTRYGFAIKAFPNGGKPFGDEEDDEQPEGTEEETLEGDDPAAALEAPSADMGQGPAAPPEDPAAPLEEPAAEPPAEGAEPPAEGEESVDVPEPPADDARPWAGDMYDEGDETDPADSFSAYTGSNGEQAWLDRAPDGTLTGWVRDGTGQVWRYTDPDAWAVDVDGAHMTRTHSQADEPSAPPADAPPGNRGVQDSMFQQGS
ncbi:hypothetical protein [Streptomyces stelliscabiei]|uniref:hypothetical protein n=1 Tax=Streptomyces stelliscabiei TaxID=146820 RepID=UPI0029AD8680|nr:hypothetical protein [Streptomyces stelliscabiei]MDX2557946.1 hypothetical protein [Streptomyces stelliscabiei]MDX2613297.1 hypothetical protein [Streptomyces stelliscabiei]MDX2638427.1 hypothetical protein [Streptomyces stelliscabiei]MDX2661579.1 hypothetical protein [Streptomyces stelliscabiei]MDX2712288.1 hypothetical protein [Streptomyces stelliscabiei]